MDIETPSQTAETPSKKTPQNNSSFTPTPEQTVTPDFEQDALLESLMVKGGKVLNPEAELSKLKIEFGKGSTDYSGEEIGDWEFDELEQDLKTSDSSKSQV